MIDKTTANEYSNIIKYVRQLKTHASDFVLLGDRVIALIAYKGVGMCRKYAILHKPIANEFEYLSASISDITPVNAKFKKTKSEIEWYSKNELDIIRNYMSISNQDKEGKFTKHTFEIISEIKMRDELIYEMYKTKVIPIDKLELFIDDDSSNYIRFTDSEMDFMREEESVFMLPIGIHGAWINKSIVGGIKSTSWMGYRVLYSEADSTIIKIKQVEDDMDIYTCFRILDGD